MSIYRINILLVSVGIIVLSFTAVAGDGKATEDIERDELYLPDIYENTVIYNGETHPDVELTIYHKGEWDDLAPFIHEQQPFINQNGQFSFGDYR